MASKLDGLEDVLREEIEKRTPLSELESRFNVGCSIIYRWMVQKLDFKEDSKIANHYKKQCEEIRERRQKESRKRHYERNYKSPF